MVTYELVPEAEEGPGEAQVNFADAVENPNPTPEASETNLAQEGKPRSIILNFSIQCLLYNYCAFTFLGVDWNLRCMIPRFPQSLY